MLGGNPSSYTVWGLANGTSYTFTVAAINTNGTGSVSTPDSAAVPSGRPHGADNAVTTVAVGRDQHESYLDRAVRQRRRNHGLHGDPVGQLGGSEVGYVRLGRATTETGDRTGSTGLHTASR